MEIARYWRLNSKRYSLTGRICSRCGHKTFSERLFCNVCKHEKDTTSLTSETGEQTLLLAPAQH